MHSTRRNVWISLVLSSVAAVLGFVRVVTEPGGAMQAVLIWLLSIAIVAVICVGLVWFLNARLSRAVASAAPGAWSAKCVLLATPQAWRAVIADDDGLLVVDSRGRTRTSWSWDQVVEVHEASLAIGLVHRDGLSLTTKSGESVSLLFPSRNSLAYPHDLLLTARDEIERRMRAQANSHD
jgi:hypothetical protein